MVSLVICIYILFSGEADVTRESFENGVLAAADTVAQMLLFPLFGAFIDRLKTVRLVYILCIVSVIGD